MHSPSVIINAAKTSLRELGWLLNSHASMKKELAVAQNNSVEGLIAQAITAGASIDTLERLLAMRDKWMKDKAREAFVVAVAAFQTECPVIKKTKNVLNKDGRTVRYSYAPLDSAIAQMKKPLQKNGLTYRWEAKTENGKITATAIITHTLGHQETSSFEVGVDVDGFMSGPQKNASALTFAKRYALFNVLGIATGDEDDDSLSVSKEGAAKSLKAKIIFLLRSLGHETQTKEQVETAVLKTTKLKLEEKSYGEIVELLELLVTEKQEMDTSTIE